MMSAIRPAKPEDLARIAEIEIFNYRLNFYPIFRYDPFYFEELQVPSRMEYYQPLLNTLWVYDDGVVKGFFQAEGQELKKLFVEPVLQGQAIGAACWNMPSAPSGSTACGLWRKTPGPSPFTSATASGSPAGASPRTAPKNL